MSEEEFEQEVDKVEETEEQKALRELELEKWTTSHDDGSTTIILQHPLVSENSKFEAVTEIFLPLIKAKHLRMADSVKGDISRALAIIQAASGVSRKLIGELSMPDLKRVSHFL